MGVNTSMIGRWRQAERALILADSDSGYTGTPFEPDGERIVKSLMKTLPECLEYRERTLHKRRRLMCPDSFSSRSRCRLRRSVSTTCTWTLYCTRNSPALR